MRRPGKVDSNLSEVADTFLAPLYWKAMESQRPDAMLRDEKAEALVAQMMANGSNRYDFSRVRQIPMPELLKVMRIMLSREIDRYARDFLRRHPDAVVVHIGCGLDSRFERVGGNQPVNNQVEWYDLDLPEVIELRRELLSREPPVGCGQVGPGPAGGLSRYHLLGCSVLEEDWLEAVEAHHECPYLFLAETVFVYFTEAQVRSLVLRLRDHFPEAELIFDGWRPFEVWLGNRYLSNSLFAGLMRWGFWSGEEIEAWGKGIQLLDERGFFDRPEPRLAHYRWMAPLFRLFKPMRIFHFRLGEASVESRTHLVG